MEKVILIKYGELSTLKPAFSMAFKLPMLSLSTWTLMPFKENACKR